MKQVSDNYVILFVKVLNTVNLNTSEFHKLLMDSVEDHAKKRAK